MRRTLVGLTALIALAVLMGCASTTSGSAQFIARPNEKLDVVTAYGDYSADVEQHYTIALGQRLTVVDGSGIHAEDETVVGTLGDEEFYGRSVGETTLSRADEDMPCADPGPIITVTVVASIPENAGPPKPGAEGLSRGSGTPEVDNYCAE